MEQRTNNLNEKASTPFAQTYFYGTRAEFELGF